MSKTTVLGWIKAYETEGIDAFLPHERNTFESAADFRRHKEGMVASRYRVDEVQLKIINGDGAGWVQGKNSDTSIYVLDEFHRNKKLTECVKDKDFAAFLRDLLFKNDISTFVKLPGGPN